LSEVSVIIPVPREGVNGDLLQRALDALKAQTIANDIQVIVEVGEGNVAQTLNSALEKATGDYYIFHGHDDWWEPRGVERMLEYWLDQWHYIWALYTSSYNVDTQGRRIVAANAIDGLVQEQQTGKIMFTKNTGNCVNSAAAIAKMSAMNKLKDRFGFYYDERLPFHEDWDLWLRMLQMGGKVVFHEGEPVSNWQDNPRGRHNNPRQNIYKHLIYSRIKSGYYD
jgi:glycosyltransferase involved in cell wall biosynthesis